MKVAGKPCRTIWRNQTDPKQIEIIDQRFLPFKFLTESIQTVGQMVTAIKEMHLRGAPLIGAAAGYGVYLAVIEASRDSNFEAKLIELTGKIQDSRPTAINLRWAVKRQLDEIGKVAEVDKKIEVASKLADKITEEEVVRCFEIGRHGLSILDELARRKPGEVINILTHCNAGWLACVDYGTATAPIYLAHDSGIPIHVWVDETRPRNQGARLTAWELGQHGVSHTVIADNTGGHLMQNGMVDLVIVGTDRTTRAGHVANKIGTYLKALAAFDNKIPFYVAAPSSSIDWSIELPEEIPIEERDPDEVKFIEGEEGGKIKTVLLTPEKSAASNYGFDVTPARLITGLITERGVCQASAAGLKELFPDFAGG